jgi:hypothetical protein
MAKGDNFGIEKKAIGIGPKYWTKVLAGLRA